jgi:hypothetical protein
MARLKKVSAFRAFLSEQHCMVTGMVELSSNLFNHGQLQNYAGSTAMADSSKAQWFVNFAH